MPNGSDIPVVGPRDATGHYIPRLDAAERDAEACRLRQRGYTFQRIANELGYSGAANAQQGVRRALDRVTREAATELRDHEMARLEGYLRRALEIVDTEYVKTSGEAIVRDAEGNPLLDPAPRLAALRELRKISESLRRLWGLDAPAKMETTTYEVKINGIAPEDLA